VKDAEIEECATRDVRLCLLHWGRVVKDAEIERISNPKYGAKWASMGPRRERRGNPGTYSG
jgi:hypothetical protein